MSGIPTALDAAALIVDEAQVATLDMLDPTSVDWARVHRTAYLVHQHLRYEYPGPIHDLNHRLVIVPPERYGDQRRVVHRVEVDARDQAVDERIDSFGNTVMDIIVPRVETAIDFEAWIVVERAPSAGLTQLDASWLTHPYATEPSALTAPDRALREAAQVLAGSGAAGLDLAERMTAWVAAAMTYRHGVTDIHTTAAQALALRQGVCQDYAHVMLALCRLCGLPARYVSGHLLGEGGTHAWVEVLVAQPDQGVALAHPFDPTHDRRVGLSYVTVAVGRDYSDVAPTSGSYRASYSGRLSARKTVGVAAVDYGPALDADADER